MCQVLRQLKSSLAVLSALFITASLAVVDTYGDDDSVISAKVRGQDYCIQRSIANCSGPLGAVTDNRLTFAANKSELEAICPDLRKAMSCVADYTRGCMHLNRGRHFMKLFGGTQNVIRDLCQNVTYQDEFLRHAPCMKSVQSKTDNCLNKFSSTLEEITAKPPKIIDQKANESEIMYQKRKRETAAKEGVKTICCAFKEYLGCSTRIVRGECGENAAKFSIQFLKVISQPLLQLHCSEYDHQRCGLPSDHPFGLNPSTATSLTAFASTISLVSLLSTITYFLR